MGNARAWVAAMERKTPTGTRRRGGMKDMAGCQQPDVEVEAVTL